MIELIIDNSYSQITGLNSEQMAQVRQLLSYEADPNAAFFGGFQGSKRRYLIDRKGFFPTGLLLPVGKWMATIIDTVAVRDIRVKPIPNSAYTRMSLGTIMPRDEQINAAMAVIDNGRGTISMPTGSGKSLVIAILINLFAVRTLVIVPTLNIKDQLTADLEEKFGKTPNIVVMNIDSGKLPGLTNFDMLIIDEAHHVAAKTYHQLNKTAWKNIYHRVFMTATPFRNVEAEQLLFKAIAGEVIYKLSYAEAVKAKHIAPVEAHFINVPKQKTEAFTWQQVYSELVVNNQVRNDIIANLMTNLNNAEQATLCLVKEIKHGQILSEMTGFPFVCGEDAESRDYIRQFNSGRIMALIGTVGVLGEGVDTKKAEYAIIAGLGKAKSAFMQQVGRTLRTLPGKESGKVILFKDKSHKYLTRHFNAQSTILQEEYGVIPQKLEV